MPVVLTLLGLFLGVGIALTGNGLMGSLLGLRAVIEHFHPVVIGLLASSYFVGFLMAPLLVPILISRVGHIRAFVIFAAIASVAIAILGLWVQPAVWILLRVLIGFCMFGIYNVAEGWLNATVDKGSRGRIFGIYQFVNLAGLALGQLMLLAADVGSNTLFAISAMLFTLGLVPVAAMNVPQPAVSKRPRPNPRLLKEVSPLGFYALFLAGFGNAPFWGLMPIFISYHATDTTLVAITMAAIIAGGASAQIPIGMLSDRFDRRLLIFAQALCAAMAASLLMFVANSHVALLPLAGFIWGAAALPLYALSVSHLNDRMTAEQSLSAAGSMLLVYGVGAATGPLLVGIFIGFVGQVGLPIWLIFWPCCLAVFAYWRLSKRDRVAVSDQGAYIPGIQTSSNALQVQIEESLPASHTTTEQAADKPKG